MTYNRFLSRIGSLAILIIAWTSIVTGILIRYYQWKAYLPTEWLITDAASYINLGAKWLANEHQGSFDLTWPPGTSSLYSILLALDPSLSFANFVMLFVSCATLGIIAWTGYLAGGRNGFVVSSIISSFYPPFIYYTSFFLSENISYFVHAFLLLILVRFFLVSEKESLSRYLIPLSLGFACLFKGQTLIICILTFLIYSFFQKEFSCKRHIFAASFVCVLLMPFSYRCSIVNEKSLCHLSTNGSINLLFTAHPSARSICFSSDPTNSGCWTPPSRLDLPQSQVVKLSVDPDNASQSLRYVLLRFFGRPELLWQTVWQNLEGLFLGDVLWPGVHSTVSMKNIKWSSYIFTFLIFIPVFLAHCVKLSFQNKNPKSVQRRISFFVVAFTIAMILTHVLTLGEWRYRAGYDCVMIIGLACLVTGQSQGSPRINKRFSKCFIGTLSVGIFLIFLMSYPYNNFAKKGFKAVLYALSGLVQDNGETLQINSNQTEEIVTTRNYESISVDLKNISSSSQKITISGNWSFALSWYKNGSKIDQSLFLLPKEPSAVISIPSTGSSSHTSQTADSIVIAPVSSHAPNMNLKVSIQEPMR